MKNLFLKLAVTGIRKNRKIYLPYIISCIGCVSMYYIIDFLSRSKTFKSFSGGSTLSNILGFGKFIIIIFDFLFLFYTNSFLAKRRNKEFGLYNILGMDKKNIVKILFWESLTVAVTVLTLGIIFGIVLSKLSELLLLYIIDEGVKFGFSIPIDSLKYTLIMFFAIFILLFIKSLINLAKSDVLSLLNSEKAGEKPLKANWIFAVLGFITLISAYIISVTIKSPLSTISLFMIAVIMVIISTYILFISGSVALCKFLQKRKNYYYKKNHFISVSSMSYRMKRNGAGLASVCILSTMVLVMIASTSSLYFGENDAIKSRFPQENQIEIYFSDINQNNNENVALIKNEFNKVFGKNKCISESTLDFSYCEITGLLNEKNKIDVDAQRHINDLIVGDNLRSLYFLKLDDYNRIMNTDYNLSGNEVLIYSFRSDYNENSIFINGLEFEIKEKLDEVPTIGSAKTAVVSSLFIIVRDYNVLSKIDKLKDFNGDRMLDVVYYYGYNLSENDKLTVDVFKENNYALKDLSLYKSGKIVSLMSDCALIEKNDYTYTFGGLFFIGIMLSIIFVFALATIIYYKQISEGFEDSPRFEIMKNVGMTESEIKKSINSQVLTVFFAPLVLSGIHLSFAFPMIWKLLQLFNLSNLKFVIFVSVLAFLAFCLVYIVIYKLTAHSYYLIVSKKQTTVN